MFGKERQHRSIMWGFFIFPQYLSQNSYKSTLKNPPLLFAELCIFLLTLTGKTCGSPIPQNTYFSPQTPHYLTFILLPEAISEVPNVPKLKKRSPGCPWSSRDRKAKVDFHPCKFPLNKHPPLASSLLLLPSFWGLQRN